MVETERILNRLLNKIAIEQKYENYQIIINEISSGGANITSKLFTVIIKEANKDDLHLFAKVIIMGKKMRSTCPMAIFETERFAYTKLWKIYESLEVENGVPQEHTLLNTKCYGFDPTLYQEILVLENLLAQGFAPFNRFKTIDWEYASSAVTELAKLHASSFAYREKFPEDFEKFLANIKLNWKEGVMDTITQGSMVQALKVIKPNYKEALEKFMDIYMKDLYERFNSPIRQTVLVHGDYRGSNLMHRVREDGKVDIKIVDLQTLQGGSPVTDLLFFIITGSDEQFRAHYYDKLIGHYYTQLSDAMKRLHLNPDEIYSREDFDYELNEKLPFGLTLAVFCLPLVTVENEKAPQVVEDLNLELSAFSMENTSEIYIERLNGVINDYVKWGILKL